MKYTLDHIAGVLGSSKQAPPQPVEQLLFDSRRVYFPTTSLFFALKGPRKDGHRFIPELYRKGVRSFVVSEALDETQYPGACFISVPNTLVALQELATYHRQQFQLRVIGITGSNGKTIVKEWLYQLLHPDHVIARSPKSYNSQIGVPLSVWQLNGQQDLALFEAGISRPGEMEKLERIIRPNIGVLTNIGDAHNEGFRNREEKLEEKGKLFPHCEVLIGREADLAGHSFPGDPLPSLLTWGPSLKNYLPVTQIRKEKSETYIVVSPDWQPQEFSIPFTDDASVENALTCYAVLHYLKVPVAVIAERMKTLQPVYMRLERKRGINYCVIINDSYSADLHSLGIALDFLDQQSGGAKKTVILSDLLQSAETDDRLYPRILQHLRQHGVSRLIGIGERLSASLGETSYPDLAIELFPSTEAYLQQFLSSQFREEVVLVKGARVFGFERIVQLLEQKVHQTVLEINLNGIVHNLKAYQQQLKSATRIMAMVKAFAYGSGGAEIAAILEYHKVDYLGVAYADEGIELRRTGITLPIMIMNPEETAFDAIVEYNLEPDLYSFAVLRQFESFLVKEGLQSYPVHLEIETGMNRLGFSAEEIPALAQQLANSKLLRVQSVFSHLSSSDDPAQDEYSRLQFRRYQDAVAVLDAAIASPFLRHIANSAAIFRLPELQLDMVRLGIGLYGVDSAGSHQSLLMPVATLRSTIAQLKQLKSGESVSYNRRGMVKRDSVIATVRIGYADGYSRQLGNGVASMLVRGKRAPVIGAICMDMTMIDVTDIPGVSENDEVVVFGAGLPVQELAQWAGTIAYEIMTGISQRVKRVYFQE